MITVPEQQPSLFAAIEKDFGTTISASLWQKIALHMTWFNLNVPVGMVMFFHGSQRLADGTPGTLITQPFAGSWQYADGSTVSNSESPVDGQTLPDLRDLFPKHSTTIGTLGGSDTLDLEHFHANTVGFTDDKADFTARRSGIDDFLISHGGPHRHTIGPLDNIGSVSKIPPFRSVQGFIRIDGSLTGGPILPTDGTFQGVDDDSTVFGKLVSNELATAISDALDYLQKSIPIGMISPILTNITGVPTPDPNIWQVCDGSEITNINSPLRSVGGSSRFTPDLTDRFVRFVTNLGTVGQNFGANTTNAFVHNHTGFTADFLAPQLADTELNEDFNTLAAHRHSIGTDLPGPHNLEPAFHTLKWYIKIQ